MTASTSPTDWSACHSKRASPPRPRTASIASNSQFDPGNSTTPTVAVIPAPRVARSLLHQFVDAHVRILDDRIREEPVAEVVHLSAGRRFVGRVDDEADR